MALTQSNVWDYFETISPLAQHMVEEAKKVIAKEDNRWEQMSQEERERAIDCHFIDPTISAQYETLGTLGNEDTALEMIFPRLKFQSGRETVRFKDGDREVCCARDDCNNKAILYVYQANVPCINGLGRYSY
jgi:hypothetical protein